MPDTSDAKKPSWRELYPAHPCADVFPMISDTELEALAQDIKQTGEVREPIVLWTDNTSGTGPAWQVLDGRNRLAALASLGITLPAPDGHEPSRDFVTADGDKVKCCFDFRANCRWIGTTRIESGYGILRDPAAFVISANIRRRHLTKEQQAELIVKTIEAGQSTDRATVARSVKRDSNGRVQGSTKDPVLHKAVTEAQKHGISKRTVQSARAKLQGKPTRTGDGRREKKPAAVVPKKEEPLSVSRYAGHKLDVPTFLVKVKPLVEALAAEGRKNMATMSPGTVAHLTFQLAHYLDRLTRDTTPTPPVETETETPAERASA